MTTLNFRRLLCLCRFWCKFAQAETINFGVTRSKIKVTRGLETRRRRHFTIRYDSVYLTCSKKLTGSQLSLASSSFGRVAFPASKRNWNIGPIGPETNSQGRQESCLISCMVTDRHFHTHTNLYLQTGNTKIENTSLNKQNTWHSATNTVTWITHTDTGWRFGLVVTRWLRST